jgi:hypothetical protein
MADANVRTYDPAEVSLTIGAYHVSGFASGTFIKVTRSGDAFTKERGADGTVDRKNNNIYDFELEFSLRRTSPYNGIFSGLLAADQQTNEGVLPVTISDGSGYSLFFAADAWIRKDPDGEYADALGNYTWKWDTGLGSNFLGGN